MRVSNRWSVQASKGKLSVVVYYHTKDEVYKQKWLATGLPIGKRNEAKAKKMAPELIAAWVKEVEQAEKDAQNPHYAEWTVEDAGRDWLEVHSKGIDPVTAQGYDNLLYVHIVPRIGRVNVTDVTLPILQKAVNYWAAKGNTRTGAGLSPKSIKMILNCLKQINAHAKLYGYPNVDWPIDQVTRPRVQRPEIDVLTGEQVKELINANKGTQTGALLVLACYYGLRRSEILGLRWGAISEDEKSFVINHTVSRVTGDYIAKDRTKTDSSHRRYPINDELRAELENLKKAHPDAKPEDYVFVKDDGTRISGDMITGHIKAAAAKLGIYTTPHKLRHTCATLMLTEAGLTLHDVQGWMGHSDISTTANVYGHFTDGRKKEILERMGERLN